MPMVQSIIIVDLHLVCYYVLGDVLTGEGVDILGTDNRDLKVKVLKEVLVAAGC